MEINSFIVALSLFCKCDFWQVMVKSVCVWVCVSAVPLVLGYISRRYTIICWWASQVGWHGSAHALCATIVSPFSRGRGTADVTAASPSTPGQETRDAFRVRKRRPTEIWDFFVLKKCSFQENYALYYICVHFPVKTIVSYNTHEIIFTKRNKMINSRK